MTLCKNIGIIPEPSVETLKLFKLTQPIPVFSSLTSQSLRPQVQITPFLHLAGGKTVVPSAESAIFALGIGRTTQSRASNPTFWAFSAGAEDASDLQSDKKGRECGAGGT